MTKLNYKLENGTVVNTYKEAVESGLRFETVYTEVEKEPCKMTEKRKAMRVKI